MMKTSMRAVRREHAARVRELVRTHGWAIQLVGMGGCEVPGCDGGTGDTIPFAYTIGLHGFGHPELLLFSLPDHVAMRVLNALGERIRDGDRLVEGEVITVEGWWQRFVPEAVPNPGEIVLAANAFHGRSARRSVPVLQLSHDDHGGRFPWEPAYAAPGLQPRPGTFRA